MVDDVLRETQSMDPTTAEAAPVAAPPSDEAQLPSAKPPGTGTTNSAAANAASTPPPDEAGLPLREEQGDVFVDPVAKAKLEEHKKAIVELLAGGPKNAREVGSHITAIVREKLATRAGYKHLASFIVRELPAGRTSIKKYRRMHRYFSQDQIAKFGVERLTWFHTFRTLTGCATPPDLADLVIEVPNRNGGTRRVRFAECTKSDLRAASRVARLNACRPKGMKLVEFLDSALFLGTGGRVRASALYSRRGTKVRLSAFALKDARGVAEACRKLADEIDELVRADSLTVL